MMPRCVLTLALLFYAVTGCGSQITPFLGERGLGVAIESTEWPATLNKDLTSGLANRILIRVRLLQRAQVVRERAVEITIRYDLWDERFALSVSVDGAEVEARTLRTKEEVLVELGALRFRKLFEIPKSAGSELYLLTTEMLLNPIDRERMEMIKKWVVENSAGPTDMGAHPSESALGAAIFNRIFEQYASGADIAAVWREVGSSRPFRVEDLSDEAR